MTHSPTDELLAKLIRLASLNLKILSEVHMDVNTLKLKVAELEAKVDANTALDNQVVALLQDQAAAIADLKAQLGAGVAVSQADLDALGAKVQSSIDKLSAANAAEQGALGA